MAPHAKWSHLGGAACYFAARDPPRWCSRSRLQPAARDAPGRASALPHREGACDARRRLRSRRHPHGQPSAHRRDPARVRRPLPRPRPGRSPTRLDESARARARVPAQRLARAPGRAPAPSLVAEMSTRSGAIVSSPTRTSCTTSPCPARSTSCAPATTPGAMLVYLTGRDLPLMGTGTFPSLRDLGFPIGRARARSWCSSRTRRCPTRRSSATVAPELARLGHVIAAFDNEPANCNVMLAHYPDAHVVFVDTQHMPGGPRARPRRARRARLPHWS